MIYAIRLSILIWVGCILSTVYSRSLYRQKHLLVESNRGAEDVVEDIGVIVDELVGNEAEDTHLGSAAVVKLNGGLLSLGLSVPATVGHLLLASLSDILLDS
jgi:hypothetical protein